MPAIEKTKDGHSTRLRYGKGLRRRFEIKLLDEQQAQLRADALERLAGMLTKAGKSKQAPLILEEGGAVQTEQEFQEVVQVAEGLCRDVPKALKAKLPEQPAVTFKQLAEQWIDGTLQKKWPDHVKPKRSVDTDEGRLKLLYKFIGNVPLKDFKLEHAERAMAGLPDGLSPTTRRAYAQLISKVLKLAVYPCKYITASPLPPEFMPSRGNSKAFSFLYPDEDAKLLAFVEVPVERRLLYGVLAREGMRLSEAKGLTWRELDLERGTLTLDKNKTSDPRVWALNPEVAEALRRWRKKHPNSTQVFEGLPVDHMADVFRTDLKAAGVKRAELFEASDQRSPIRVHDLRATFVTLALANGRTEAWVTDRTGHRSSQMIANYRRQARTASELGLGDLLGLAEALPELAKGPSSEGEAPPSEPSCGPGHGPEGGPQSENGPSRRDEKGRDSDWLRGQDLNL